jgi:hypothetical protein
VSSVKGAYSGSASTGKFRLQLHLAGLLTRAAMRSLQVTSLVEEFDTYPRLTNALTALTDAPEVTISAG